MNETELMPIGVFARRTGLTTSALRFYDDAGLLAPADVDPSSGYRYYGPDQIPRAELLRDLREISMPLSGIREVFDVPPEEAGSLIDAHVAGIALRRPGPRRSRSSWVPVVRAPSCAFGDRCWPRRSSRCSPPPAGPPITRCYPAYTFASTMWRSP